VKRYVRYKFVRVSGAITIIALVLCIALSPFERLGGWATSISLFGTIFFFVAAIDIGIIISIENDRKKADKERATADQAALEKRASVYWKDADRLIKDVLLQRAPSEFADKLSDRILACLESQLKPMPVLFRAARLFVEARLLASAKCNQPALPMEGLTLDEAYARIYDTIVTVLSGLNMPAEAESYDNCFDLNNLVAEEASAARQYFQTLATISAEHEKTEGQQGRIAIRDRFITPVKVVEGFVAPTYLVAGLLNQFDSTWGQALDQFAAALGGNPDLLALVQRFEFYCWLLWGPSIPACTCQRWLGDFLALQYGYGDENNSFPLLLDEDVAEQAWHDIVARLRQGEPHLALAVAGTFEGTIVWGPAYRAGLDNFPSIYSVPTLDGKQKLRLYVNPPRTGAIARRSILEGLALRASKTIQWSQAPKRYYSAYMWIMFEVCSPDGKPLYNDPADRWMSLFPLFEHANSGDGQTLTYLKERLAEKALAALVQFTSDGKPWLRGEKQPWVRGEGKPWLRYVCATDDPGGVSNQDGPHRLRFRLDTTEDAVLRNDSYGMGKPPDLGTLGSADKNRLRNILAGMIDDPVERTRVFAPHAEKSAIITSCDLPEVIDDFYRKFLSVPANT
jgi:hypothetical protein